MKGQKTLFGPQEPLASRLRPGNFDEMIGQNHISKKGGILEALLAQKPLPSLILWGPAGSGKTTLAQLLIRGSHLPYHEVSAVFSGGVNELRRIFAQGTHESVCLFVDEIHRFNRAQQDIFLPYLESGALILVGATTENPSFTLNAPLLSRCRVVTLNRLDTQALEQILLRAERILQKSLPLTPEARSHLIAMADGDARYLLNQVESLLACGYDPVTLDTLAEILQARAPIYDRDREEHYNLISALHKSMRGSDADAALYYLNRMLRGGEDPRYIARRILRFAWEDIGLADPQAPQLVINAWQTYERLGSPEGEIALAAAVTYLSLAPKSNATYKASKLASTFARRHGNLAPPKHMLNAPTSLMKELGYGKDYSYDHDEKDAFSGQNYFPDGLTRPHFYQPTARGFERELQKRSAWFKKRRLGTDRIEPD